MSGLSELTANQGGSNGVTSAVKLSGAGRWEASGPGWVRGGAGREGAAGGQAERANEKLLTATCPLRLPPQSPSD